MMTLLALRLYSHFFISFIFFTLSLKVSFLLSLFPLNEFFSAPQLGTTWKEKID